MLMNPQHPIEPHIEASAPGPGASLNGHDIEQTPIPPELPVLPVRGLVLFPQVVLPVAITDARDIRLVNDAVLSNRMMAMVTVKEDASDPPPRSNSIPSAAR